MMERNRLQIALVVTSAIVIANLANNASARTGLPACTAPSISTCGCAITKAGDWVVANDLSGNPSEDCIDIAAAKVNLRTNAHKMTGSGGTGIGINILKSAANANVQLADPSNPSKASVITGFATGIAIQGSGAIVSGGPVPPTGGQFGFDVSGNKSDGLQIKGASNCFVVNFTSNNSATGNGVTISGGSGCQIDSFTASGNAGFGLEMLNVKGAVLNNFVVDDSSGAGNASGGISLASSSSNMLSDFFPINNVGSNVVLTNSSKNTLTGFLADGSSKSGLVLSGSSSNAILDFETNDNAVYGVWVQSSGSNSIRFASAFGNAEAGIFIGCSATGPGGACSGGSKPSSKNTVTGIQAGNDTRTTPVIPQAFGVAVDTGDLQNNLSGITATGNSKEDLDDENASCGTNVWFANAGTLVKPSGSPSCTEP
jgi:hypothetical protein